MQSELFRLNWTDLAKGVVTAVFAGVIVALGQLVTQDGFNVFTANWGAISMNALNVGIASGLGYILKNYLSDSRGRVMGRIG